MSQSCDIDWISHCRWTKKVVTEENGDTDTEIDDVVQRTTDGFLGRAIPALPLQPGACHVTES
jgi:hypothetical protein